MPLVTRLGPILVLALAVRLANITAMANLPIATYQESWRDSDMQVNTLWADRIVAGDWLGREPAHPYTLWMAMIAPQATWERWWGGHLVFQQAPLYAYVLAAFRGIGGTGFWPVALGHCLLGLASVALVFLIAARTFDLTVATVAGLLAATYGPLVFHECLWLRDTLGVTTSLLLLWALGRAAAGGMLRWLVAGVAFALAMLTRETTLLFAPFALGWTWRRVEPRRRLASVAALLVGVALGLAPLVARNVAVDAPPLAFSTRAIEGFIYGHAADGSPTDFDVPNSAKRILTEADGSLLKAMQLTLATHETTGHLVWWELQKLASVFASYEPADNANWYYFAERSTVLRLGPPFVVVFALGLVGLWLERRRGPDERLLRWFCLASVVGLMYATVLARYRLVLVAALMPHAAATVVRVARALRQRQWLSAAAPVAATAVLAVLSTRLYAEHRERLAHRLNEPIIAAIELSKQGLIDEAFAEIRQGLAEAHRDPNNPLVLPGGLQAMRVLMLLSGEAGRARDIIPDLDAMLAEFPNDPTLQQYAGEHWRDRIGDAERATPYFQQAERLRQAGKPPPAG